MLERVSEALSAGLMKVFGSRNARLLAAMQPLVERINSLEPEVMALSEEQLRGKTAAFKKRLAEGETLDDLLCEAFATMREACRRAVKNPNPVDPRPTLRHFDVQLIGGIVLHQGKIAEMATGEGKTLVALLPAYLNALEGKGVHIVTVNDYLARRDRAWMGPAFELLGMSVGVIQHEMDPAERRQAYACDVTYARNDELGFDYLRNNMALRVEDQAIAQLHYAIVDEVDSILVDEARTPLIITGPTEEATEKYYQADRVATRLRGVTKVEYDQRTEKGEAKEKIEEDYDFIWSEKDSTVHLTERGNRRAEELLGVDDFFTGRNMEWPHHITQALRAHFLFRKDRDYVVKDGEVLIVDEFTGRLMPGRRWSDGLHQAVEAQEHLKIREESQTVATITYQNFFRLYEKLAGMTGTAMTEAAEFDKIYRLEVVAIPTNKPLRRTEHADVIFRTAKEKYDAVEEEIVEVHNAGRPILVGTTSIEKSELLSERLNRRGIEHEVLNAKHHEREALIVAKAGQMGHVTIATNMAGRGTDIVLGPGVSELGGLHIVGTERHEARRIDNQLRGRAGRQGDPGSSRFFLSLEDDLMRMFAADWVGAVFKHLGMTDGVAIEHRLVSRAIERAQKRVEEHNFEIRKQLLEYDEVMDQQRKAVYSQRQQILEGRDLRQMVSDMVMDVVEENLQAYLPPRAKPEEWDRGGFLGWLRRALGIELGLDDLATSDVDSIRGIVEKAVEGLYDERCAQLGAERMKMVERFLLLQAIDSRWKEHLYAMDHLKGGIGLRSYGQQDPLVEYKREAFDLFEDIIYSVKDQVAELIFRVRIEESDVAEYRGVWRVDRELHEQFASMSRQREQAVAASKGSEKGQPIRVGVKVGRNDPCPCGSGKKYKKCCGA